jgi:phytoene desaturase
MTTCTRAVAPSPERLSPRLQAAVIGSGFGSLAAAIRLQARGYHVHLFEMRDKPGGRAYVYQQDGFTFDAGPTMMPVLPSLRRLF